MWSTCWQSPQLIGTHQVASFSLQGRAIERSEVQQPDFKVKAEQLTLNLFPAEVSATAGEDFGRQVLPLSTDHLMQIFGACVLPDEYLTSWNDQIQEVVQRVRLASLGVLLCSQREQGGALSARAHLATPRAAASDGRTRVSR